MKKGKRPNTLVTGGRGFIAKYLRSPYDPWDLKDGKDILKIDKCKGPYKFVLHAAAVHTELEDMFRTNVDGTLKVVERANQWGAKVIFISSAAVYGNRFSATEESSPSPINLYGFSKVIGEYIVQQFAKDWTILRLSNVFGTGGAGVVSKWDEQAKPLLNYDGIQYRDFIFVESVIEFIEIVKKQDLNGIYNVSSGRATQLKKIYDFFTVVDSQRKQKFQNPVTHPLMREIETSGLNNFKARQAGFNPQGLSDIIDGFRD